MSDDAVLAALGRAVAATPDDVELRLHYATMLLDRARTDEAIAQIGAALQRTPDSSTARALMSRALAPSDVHLAPADAFDWHRAESDVTGIAEPMFVDSQATTAAARPPHRVTFADVGGMTSVKERLDAAFLAPLRNPELRNLYGKSLRGGLLLYGPPGCGKTYLARALAGELGAGFLSAGLSDILDPMLGVAESNVHELFQEARRSAPVVLFLDEIDALGQHRNHMVGTAMRGVVNQLLTELDGVDADNEGVFVLAATNQPWDVDPALRRPGRFDRTLLVLPPDEPARRAILERDLASRPVEGIDLGVLAAATDGLSGADLAHVCETAAERALVDSVRTGTVRMIAMADLTAAIGEVRPSVGDWLGVARNVVLFGADDGTYTELRSYLKGRKRL